MTSGHRPRLETWTLTPIPLGSTKAASVEWRGEPSSPSLHLASPFSPPPGSSPPESRVEGLPRRRRSLSGTRSPSPSASSASSSGPPSKQKVRSRQAPGSKPRRPGREPPTDRPCPGFLGHRLATHTPVARGHRGAHSQGSVSRQLAIKSRPRPEAHWASLPSLGWPWALVHHPPRTLACTLPAPIPHPHPHPPCTHPAPSPSASPSAVGSSASTSSPASSSAASSCSGEATGPVNARPRPCRRRIQGGQRHPGPSGLGSWPLGLGGDARPPPTPPSAPAQGPPGSLALRPRGTDSGAPTPVFPCPGSGVGRRETDGLGREPPHSCLQSVGLAPTKLLPAPERASQTPLNFPSVQEPQPRSLPGSERVSGGPGVPAPSLHPPPLCTFHGFLCSEEVTATREETRGKEVSVEPGCPSPQRVCRCVLTFLLPAGQTGHVSSVCAYTAHARTRTRMCTHARARTHTCTHTRTHTGLSLKAAPSFLALTA